VQDVTQLQEAEKALRESEERWKFALEGAGDGVWDWNLQTGELFLSAQEMNVLGYEGEGPVHTNIGAWLERQHPDDMARRKQALDAYLEGRAPLYICEFRTRGRDGSWRWVLARGMLVSHTPEGKPLRMIGTHADITARKHAEDALRESGEKLRVLANTDTLTGIANRRHFLEQVEFELARTDRFHNPGALIMLDLDYFKRINDTYGHPVGDAVLRHFTATAQHRLRKIDLLGRLGGEEFGIFLPGTDAQGAMAFADKLRAHIEATPAPSDKGPIKFTVSMGVAEFDPEDSALEKLLVRADIALYRAKEGGRNQVKAG
jgi:diguanylate cyclase (GGDEF)-like protein/PAS domain S-box-containing protein